MLLLSFLFLITQTLALPLQQTSLLTLRTWLPPRGTGGGNVAPPAPYGPLVLEEWNGNTLLQQWNAPCALTGMSTEQWTEGRLNPRYPWGDQAWFLCRNVPINSSLATNPAPVDYVYLSEDGSLNTWVEEPLYPNGTNLLNVIPYWDEAQSLNVFYLLGGGASASGPISPARPAQARIRVDTGPGQPPDAQGALLANSIGITINQLRILNKTLYGPGLFSGSTGIPGPTIFQIGAENSLPTGTRNPVTNIPNFPLVLSVWTDPFSTVWWRTGINRTAYLARYDNSDGSDLVFALPPSASAGTLGGVSWSILSGRQEGTDFAVYLTNTSHIVKNTLNGLTNGVPYQSVVQAPSGWRYLSAHARNPNIPSPSATATATASSSATATSTSSASASATSTATTSGSPSATASPTATSCSTLTATPTASSSASASTSASATASRNPDISPQASPSVTPSATPSNGTIPIPPNNNQGPSDTLSPGVQTGIGLGTIAFISVAGLLIVKFTPSLNRLYIRQFGSSVKTTKKTVSFRNPVSSDAPITISHNPQVLVQQRLEQLKDLQKQLSTRELQQTSTKTPDIDRTKKQFGPTIITNKIDV